MMDRLRGEYKDPSSCAATGAPLSQECIWLMPGGLCLFPLHGASWLGPERVLHLLRPTALPLCVKDSTGGKTQYPRPFPTFIIAPRSIPEPFSSISRLLFHMQKQNARYFSFAIHFFLCNTEPMNFKEELRKYLECKQMKQIDLAKRAGVSQSVISLFLSGKRGLTLSTVEKLQSVMK